MPAIASLVRGCVVIGCSMALGACAFLADPFGYFNQGFAAKAGVRFGQINAAGQTSSCVVTPSSGSPIDVSCSLQGPGGFGATSTTVLNDLPGGTIVGASSGVMIVQMPAGMSNVRGTYTGASAGSLNVTPVTAALAADNASSIVAEPGTRLWIIFPPSAPGQHEFVLYYDEDGTTVLPLRLKVLFTQRIATAGRVYYPPLFPCTPDFAAIPAIALPTANMLTPINLSPMATQVGCAAKAYHFGAAASADVVEYYNLAFDHYFITHVPAEIAILDAGIAIKGWSRTGRTFKTSPSAQPGWSEVCRFYIPPGLGDSHFFGRGTAECSETAAKFPAFTLEDPRFMYMVLSAAGVCPAGLVPVYRVFSNRLDANHRYMIDRALRDQMVATGWLAEGDGPDQVVMCAPV